jgi:hypothetical protein
MTVTDWLLDADPAIRWQVMRDLTDASADKVAAERARVAVEAPTDSGMTVPTGRAGSMSRSRFSTRGRRPHSRFSSSAISASHQTIPRLAAP